MTLLHAARPPDFVRRDAEEPISPRQPAIYVIYWESISAVRPEFLDSWFPAILVEVELRLDALPFVCSAACAHVFS